MMELFLRIPENVGWMINGALIVALVYTTIKVVKVIAQMWREWHEEISEED